MAVFFTSAASVVPSITTAIKDALNTSPPAAQNLDHEAAKRTVSLIESAAPKFNVTRFLAAVVIAVLLLIVAIWTKKQGMDDISKTLMDSFVGFSGLVLGLLGGEAQKAAK